jgi:cobyric acid synthase
VPWLTLDLDDEDSLAPRLERRAAALIDVAVIRLPHLSNFTDFNALGRFESVSVRYVSAAGELGRPDLIILPGTKNTMGDLLWLRQNGLEALIVRAAAQGAPVLGICGGYQMLGARIADPDNAEHGGEMRGLGLLPGETVFAREKTRTRREGTVQTLEGLFAPLSGASFAGYEIHMGRTDRRDAAVFASLSPGGGRGRRRAGQCPRQLCPRPVRQRRARRAAGRHPAAAARLCGAVGRGDRFHGLQGAPVRPAGRRPARQPRHEADLQDPRRGRIMEVSA